MCVCVVCELWLVCVVCVCCELCEVCVPCGVLRVLLGVWNWRVPFSCVARAVRPGLQSGVASITLVTHTRAPERRRSRLLRASGGGLPGRHNPGHLVRGDKGHPNLKGK